MPTTTLALPIKMLSLALLFTMLLVGLVVSTEAQDVAAPAAAEDEALRKRIETYLDAAAQHGHFCGSVLVARQGRILVEKGYGLANREWNLKNGAQTHHRIASITKSFTAALVLKLVEEEKLNLDKKIVDYLPDYRADTGAKVSIRNLLQHSSGIPSYTEREDFAQISSRATVVPAEFVNSDCSGDLEFEPGKEFRYCNSGYFILGRIIEKVTGQSFADALQKRVLKPAGLKDTGLDQSNKILPRRATGHQRVLNSWRRAPYVDMSVTYAAGAMYSTVADLFRWDRALRNDSVLSKASREKLYDKGISNYAMGWVIERVPLVRGKTPRTLAIHGGSIFGFSTLIMRCLEEEHVVILLANASDVDTNRCGRMLIRLLYGFPAPTPTARLDVALAERILAEGKESALAWFAKEQKIDRRRVPGEPVMNRVAYQLKRAGELDHALSVFRFNTEVFSKSANVWDSLAEACAEKGLVAEAIQHYEKAVKMAPTNEKTKAKLKAVKERQIKR